QESGEGEAQKTDHAGKVAVGRRRTEQARDEANHANHEDYSRQEPVAHHAAGCEAKQDSRHIQDADKREMNKALVALLVRGVVVAAGGGVFSGAVFVHKKKSPGRSKKAGPRGGSAILTAGQRHRAQPLRDGRRRTSVSAALCRAATALTAKDSIASLNNR